MRDPTSFLFLERNSQELSLGHYTITTNITCFGPHLRATFHHASNDKDWTASNVGWIDRQGWAMFAVLGGIRIAIFAIIIIIVVIIGLMDGSHGTAKLARTQ